jgi:hypothetical protein
MNGGNMNMVKDYFKILENAETLSTPEGFCIYRVEGPALFMVHFYAKKGKSFDFFKKVLELGKDLGVECITGHIDLENADIHYVSRRLRIFLGLGAKIIEADNQRITVLKLL